MGQPSCHEARYCHHYGAGLSRRFAIGCLRGDGDASDRCILCVVLLPVYYASVIYGTGGCTRFSVLRIGARFDDLLYTATPSDAGGAYGIPGLWYRD